MLLLFPLLTESLITKYESIPINSASLMYQKYYMFDKKTSPATTLRLALSLIYSSIGDGQSYLEVSLDITKNNPEAHSQGVIEVIVETGL